MQGGELRWIWGGGVFVAELQGPPEIDVDLLWHTHMMTGSTYVDHNTKLFGAVMHHAPKRDSSTYD